MDESVRAILVANQVFATYLGALIEQSRPGSMAALGHAAAKHITEQTEGYVRDEAVSHLRGLVDQAVRISEAPHRQ